MQIHFSSWENKHCLKFRALKSTQLKKIIYITLLILPNLITLIYFYWCFQVEIDDFGQTQQIYINKTVDNYSKITMSIFKYENIEKVKNDIKVMY